jgi:hypothetical protein
MNNLLPIFISATGTARALVSGLYIYNGTGGGVINLPAVTSASLENEDGRFFYIKNRGTGNVTITPSTGQIYHQAAVANLVLTPGESIILIPDNGFYTVFGASNVSPPQFTTALAPAYAIGKWYFDTTLNKLRVGGAAGWETVTSV